MDRKIDRFDKYMKAKALNDNKVTVQTGLSVGTIGKSRRPNRDLSDKSIEQILNFYTDLDRVWLLTGEGEMYSDKTKEESITPIHLPKYKEKTIENEVINLYDIDAAANLKTLLAAKGEYIIGKIMIPNAPKCDGALYVRGDSMYPLLKSGDIVAYKEITPDLQNIFWGEMYVVDIDVDGDDYLVVKYVNKSDKGEDWIKLVSYNQYHQPKDFPISCIRAMALVKLSIRMNTIK